MAPGLIQKNSLRNALNHPNFGLPGGGSLIAVDVPGGAAITNTATDNREIEFALKYAF